MHETTKTKPEDLKSGKEDSPKTVRRNRWLKDISIGDNQYLHERLVSIFSNLVSHYCGAIYDPDTFIPIQNLMRREKALELFACCSTGTNRGNGQTANRP